MSSGIPLRRSKRKNTESTPNLNVKRHRNQLYPAPSKAESSAAQLSGTQPLSANPPASPGPSNTAQLNLTQDSPPMGHIQLGGPASAIPSASRTQAAEGTKAGAAGKLKAAAKSGLESALRALHISADVVPPLKPAIGEFVACLDAATSSAEEYAELTYELANIARMVQEYLVELDPEDQNSSATCERVAQSIEAEVAHIKKQQGRGKGKRVLKSTEDKEDVIKRYKKIESLFRQLQGDITLQTWRNTKRNQLNNVRKLLGELQPVDDALHDSGYSTIIERRGCTKETREKVQADLRDWAGDPNGAKIYWMNGMAGTGKTTIAYSLCEWLKQNQRLGGSFFCSRTSTSCRNVNSIIPTIVHQLAWGFPVFRSSLCKVLEESDPSDSKRNVVKQFEKLLQGPMATCVDAMPGGVVIVIDALDECENDHGVRLILGTLLKLVSTLPLKFLITSRPEPAIRDSLLASCAYAPAMLHLHDIEESIIEGDIRKYLVEALEPMLPPPSEEQIENLVSLTGKLFIYAATVVRYVKPGGGRANLTRLDAMLASRTDDKPQSTKRYKQLDQLYTTVLAGAFDTENLEDGEIKIMQDVLWTVVCAKEPMNISALAAMLFLPEDQVSLALQSLLSVIHVSESSQLVSTMHASFPDYMFDQSRSGDFYCDQIKHNEALANSCFDLMKAQLRFNICNLESSYVFDVDVQDLDERVTINIPPALLYACQYWGHHLPLGITSTTLSRKLVAFLEYRILFWMEVLNLRKLPVGGVENLIRAERWLKSINSSKQAVYLSVEAQRFATRFAAGACVQSTPHLYVSALPLSPQSSPLYKNYRANMRRLLGVTGTVVDGHDTGALATWSVDSPVVCVNYSSNGARIVSGYTDSAIRILDALTGEVIVGPLRAHAGLVNSVAFSADSKRIVSGSDDRTIRVWDSHTGNVVIGPLQGHVGSVRSVAFSPDSTRIVSGSSDRTIRVWNSRTGEILTGPLRGHTGSVKSVAFSPDGSRIVSGSYDCTIRVWDTLTGESVVGPLRGHTDWVNSVTFSPNGIWIASGSYDKSIRVWDTHMGDVVVNPLYGHTGVVNSVAFSPDSTRIISGSSDSTIRAWDVRTGSAVASPLQGHTCWVRSVTFSPDGSRIVSGSDDCTIRVWDPCTNASDVVASPLQGHTGLVSSVAFSPDSTRIVSGSSDSTIRVWDAHTGGVVAGPLQGHASLVSSVAFSPDGTWIVSGSSDRTVRVWDSRTGKIVVGPLRGHTDWVNSVTFSHDGALIGSGSDDKTVRVWNTYTGDLVTGPLQGHTSLVSSVAFSPDGSRIASGSYDKTVRVWDMHTGGVVAGPLRGHTSSVRSIVFSPDNTQIVSGSDDCTIRVWDTRSGDVVIGPLQGHKGSVRSVAFSPDGSRIASGSYDGTIQIWDTSTGDVVDGPLRGHTDWVNSVSFSPDSTRIVSGSDDRTIRIWYTHRDDIATSTLPENTASADSLEASPNSTHITFPSSASSVRVQDARAIDITAKPSQNHTKLGPLTAHSDETHVQLGSLGIFSDLPDRLSSHTCSHLTHPDITPLDTFRPRSPSVICQRTSSPNAPPVLPSSLGGNELIAGLFALTRKYEVNSNGWIMSGSFPLFWISPNLRDYIPHPRTSVVIGPRGTLSFDYQSAVIGDNWGECFASDPWPMLEHESHDDDTFE